VEEGAAAAESLRDQSSQLVNAVSGFQLSGGSSFSSTHASTPAVMAQRVISTASKAPGVAKSKPAAPRAASTAASAAPRAKPVVAPSPKAAAPAPAAASGGSDDWETF
jgi:methyl-accepting chemotaxis protein-1 (serine sensor receptor)